MRVLPTRLSGLILLAPEVHSDDRGFFLETFNQVQHERAGVVDTFVQDNQSRSWRGTLRGLHFQRTPGQAKLVRVSRGAILDVVVDIRPGSASFGDHEAIELDDATHRQLFIPVGFAHGFCVLGESADVCYRVSSYYDPKAEAGIAWDDPDLGIAWPVADPVVSDRDRRLPRLRELSPADLGA
jgi:dTDP-4-dehydrorhamnose 3,5-epimerase